MQWLFANFSPFLRPRVFLGLRPPAEIGVARYNLAKISASLKKVWAVGVVLAHYFNPVEADLRLAHFIA